MKAIIQLGVLFILLRNTVLYGQDWQPFPTDVKLFYQTEGTLDIGTICNDSIHFGITDTIHYCNIKAPKIEWQFCYDNFYSDPYNGNKKPYFKIVNNDFLIFNNKDSLNGFLFKANISLGDFWVVPVINPSALTTELIITFDSITYQNILGVWDSVRYYSISASPPLIIENDLEGSQIILSKQHGLLTYPDFGQLVNADACTGCLQISQLVGFISGLDTLGFVTPKWSDYIQLRPNDILVFKSGSGNHAFNEYSSSYFVDKIISVNKYADSIVVTFTRNNSTNKQIVYVKEAVQPIFEGYDNSLAYGICDAQIHTLVAEPGEAYFNTGIISQYQINPNLFPDRSSIQYKVSTILTDTITCATEIMAPFTNTICTGIGLIGNEYSYYSSYSSYELIGSVLSGHANGVTWPAAQGNDANHVIQINIQTISGGNSILLPLGGSPNEHYQIYDAMGRLVQTGTIESPLIDTQSLVNGYFLLFTNHNDVQYAGKFVKTY